MSAPIWHDIEGKCLSAYARKAFGDEAAQTRMEIRDRPKWFKLHGYNLDLDERVPNTTHPARLPASNGTNYILKLDAPARNALYKHLAENVHVIGICNRPTKYCGTVTCIHPLLYIKYLRSEFVGWVEKYRMKKVTNFIAIVPDFDFGRIMSILKKNHNFKHTLRRIDLHVYHDITSEQIDSEKLLKWAGGDKFAASNSKKLLVRHAVYNMPKPELRDSFIGKLCYMDHQWNDAPQISFIIAAFSKWWLNGEGINDWADEEDSDSDAYDPEEDVVEDDDTSSIGKDLSDAKDGLMDYDWDKLDYPGPSTAVYYLDSFMDLDSDEEAETAGHVLESQSEDDKDDDDTASESSYYSELDDEETKAGLRAARKDRAQMMGVEIDEDEDDSDDEMDVGWEGVALEGQSEIEQSRYTMKVFKPMMRLMGEEYH